MFNMNGFLRKLNCYFVVMALITVSGSQLITTINKKVTNFQDTDRVQNTIYKDILQHITLEKEQTNTNENPDHEVLITSTLDEDKKTRIKYLELNLKLEFERESENKDESLKTFCKNASDNSENLLSKEVTVLENIFYNQDNKTIEENYYLGYSHDPFSVKTRYLKDINDTVHRYNNSQLSHDSPEESNNSIRSKRSVVHLYNMVLCATGCDPLAYKGYGCYCGFLGSGFVVDGIDSCCKMHDWCYDTAGCPMFLEYFVPYLWKCYRRRPLCAIDHGSYGGPGSCSQRLCECDRMLAECLTRFPCPNTKAICTSSPWRLFQNIFML